MRTIKPLTHPKIAAALVIVLGFCLAFLLTGNTTKQTKALPVVLAANVVAPVMADVPKETPVRYPVRIKIPTISVDATLEYVGLSADGILKAPKKPDSAGWFVGGPKPGEPGNAVIDGHFGYENNTAAVFDSLYKLQVGDVISITDEVDGTTNFEVREIKIFGVKDDASTIFGLGDGLAHLNLITCQGSWSDTQKSYSGRLVIFTDKLTNG